MASGLKKVLSANGDESGSEGGNAVNMVLNNQARRNMTEAQKRLGVIPGANKKNPFFNTKTPGMREANANAARRLSQFRTNALFGRSSGPAWTAEAERQAGIFPIKMERATKGPPFTAEEKRLLRVPVPIMKFEPRHPRMPDAAAYAGLPLNPNHILPNRLAALNQFGPKGTLRKGGKKGTHTRKNKKTRKSRNAKCLS